MLVRTQSPSPFQAIRDALAQNQVTPAMHTGDFNCLQHHHQENKFRADILHVFGEHDLQNFSLDELVSNFNLPAVRPEQDCLYYSTPCPGGWRLIFLDTNDVSTRSRSSVCVCVCVV